MNRNHLVVTYIDEQPTQATTVCSECLHPPGPENCEVFRKGSSDPCDFCEKKAE